MSSLATQPNSPLPRATHRFPEYGPHRRPTGLTTSAFACYGHVSGDETLRAVARVLASAAQRPADTVARYGGEEIAVLLPETDTSGATDVAERIRQDIEGLAIQHRMADGEEKVVTVSVGVATVIPRRGERREMLVELADAMLYDAKSDGRNRVRSAKNRAS